MQEQSLTFNMVALIRRFPVFSAVFILLALYSAVLLYIDISYPKETARQYFTDITGPVYFYAVNTSLDVFLLWGTALLFGVGLALLRDSSNKKEYWFYTTQIALFVYLGFDDRFMVHEAVGRLLGINDAWYLLGVGVLAFLALVTLGEPCKWSDRIKLYLVCAVTLFILMTIIDGFLPSHWTGRLAIEDLSKTWACWFFFLFAWEILMAQISHLQRHPHFLTPIPVTDDT